FANAQDNYYTEDDRVRGQWHGKLAGQWGLQGEVDSEQFARLTEGQHPLTGEQIVRHHAAYEYVNGRGETIRTIEHRAGWDATFSAPKSVSLTALVGGDDRVRAAHQQAVDVALDELERFVQARIGGNHPPETTGKWVAAKFEHDSSRPVDGYAAPQLHTHVVFFNLTERENGQSRALQPRELYRSQQYGTAIYRSELALRLRQLGYEIELTPNGAPEIKGYTQEYLEASSPRRQQIKEHLEREGWNSAEAAEIAAHRTRDAKLNIPHDHMQQKHREMAALYGNQPEHVVTQAQQQREQITEINQQEKQHAIEKALNYSRERNLEREAVVDERELLRDALKHSMGKVSLEDIRSPFERHAARGILIEMERRISDPVRSFTTEEMIRLEHDNIRLMRLGQDRHPALVTFETRRQIEQEYRHLSGSQRTAVIEILTSRDQILGVQGIAGGGKTTSLVAVRDAGEREGYRIEGFAPTSRAAHKLEEAGIEANTLQHLLARGRQAQDGKKHLYILDESSLASTRQVNEFLRRLQPYDRVLLVGDVRQHEAVEAGRPYHQLQEAGMRVARLDEIVRQKDPALKEVVEQLARGEVQQAVESLDQQGRVHQIEQREERLKHIASEYARAPEGTLVISPDNESRRQLNALIHSRLQESCQLQVHEQKLRVLDARQEMTGADRAWAGQYQCGDVLRYSKGSTAFGIKAGEYVRVKGIDQERNRITVERKNGRQVSYDPRRLQGVTAYRETGRTIAPGERIQFTAPWKEKRLANRELATVEQVQQNGKLTVCLDSGRRVEFNIRQHPHLDYGYAVTSHSSQGQTANRVLIHVESERSHQLVNRRLAYVAVSRARHDAHIYTNDKSKLAQELGRDSTRRTAVELSRTQEPKGIKLTPSMTATEGPQKSQSQGQSIGR
ncbi:MAG TPA: MobF family relaxase, partial [Terriglobales bacterium]|nr:MobF family relaxase [Terriglobales bacterium]